VTEERFALGEGDCVDVILELVRNAVGLFVGLRQGMPTRGREAVLSWGLAGVMEHQIVTFGREGGNPHKRLLKMLLLDGLLEYAWGL